MKDPVKDPVKEDFRKFMFIVWKHLGLPKPTPIQYDIAHYMQTGPSRQCIEAFRGVGKSLIASAFVAWVLYKDPQCKNLVASASKDRADAFTTFILRLIVEIPSLKFLKPKEEQRSSRLEFDVAPSIADHSPSVRSIGITGQVTGSRSDLIIGDDIEVLNNSATISMREKLIERLKEFSAVIKPKPTSKIMLLGTPQSDDSIYNKLPDTFETRIWPALIPTEKEMERYGTKLAPFIRKLAEKHPAGTPTDPLRFSDIDLSMRKAEYGKAGFSLQFMLNTALTDEDRFPLKTKDLIVMDIDKEKAPMQVNWLPDIKREIKELPNLSMAGDRFYSPAGTSEKFEEFTGSVMSIDPSGRGKDETGYAVVKFLNGSLFVTHAGGLEGGYDAQTLTTLANIAKEGKVKEIIIEANFGDGMYASLFEPIIHRIHPCLITEVKHSIQKERRIIDTLEPVIARHRLIVDRSVIEKDYSSVQAYESENKFEKSLIYQMTRISLSRGSLRHDDRLDALAIAVAYWNQSMARDVEKGITTKDEALLDEELRRFMDNFSSKNTSRTIGADKLFNRFCKGNHTFR